MRADGRARIEQLIVRAESEEASFEELEIEASSQVDVLELARFLATEHRPLRLAYQGKTRRIDAHTEVHKIVVEEAQQRFAARAAGSCRGCFRQRDSC